MEKVSEHVAINEVLSPIIIYILTTEDPSFTTAKMATKPKRMRIVLALLGMFLNISFIFHCNNYCVVSYPIIVLATFVHLLRSRLVRSCPCCKYAFFFYYLRYLHIIHHCRRAWLGLSMNDSGVGEGMWRMTKETLLVGGCWIKPLLHTIGTETHFT